LQPNTALVFTCRVLLQYFERLGPSCCRGRSTDFGPYWALGGHDTNKFLKDIQQMKTIFNQPYVHVKDLYMGICMLDV
jgi:hypothetical protein